MRGLASHAPARIPFCIVCLALAILSAGPHASAQKLRSEKLTPLFNGRDLTGWKPVGTATAWTAQNSEIVCSGDGSGWLRTEKEYQNFVLRAEYNIASNGNSGIFIHAPEKGRSSRLGFEVQILDDFGKPPKMTSTAALYEVLAPTKNMSKPSGAWNQIEITCDGPHIVVVLNSEKVIDMRTDDSELNASRTEVFKPEKRQKRGYIGLQNHHSPVRFRNLMIRVLPDTPDSKTAR